MKTLIAIASLGLTLVACDMAPAEAAPVEDEAAFMARCKADGGVECGFRWRAMVNAAPMAEAVIALAPLPGQQTLSREDMRRRLPRVRWSSATEGELENLRVRLPADGRIAFDWRKVGAEVAYDLPGALRARGVALQTLGCPQYPGAAVGQEWVLRASPPGRADFTLSVYVRPAPAGFAPGVYEADVEFARPTPTLAALRAGKYPGGGGRAFATDPTGWATDCP